MKSLPNHIITLTFAAGLLVLASCTPSGEGDTMPITTNSERARELFLEGRELNENYLWNESRELFDLALEEDPNFVLAHYYAATVYHSPANFRKHLRQAQHAAPRASKGEQLLVASLKTRESSGMKGSIKLIEEIVELYPRDKRAHLWLGIAYRQEGSDLKKAVKHLKKSISLDKDFAGPYNELGYAYKFMGEMKKAEKTLKKYAELLPNDPNPFDSMGELLRDLGRLSEANENYQKAFSLNEKFTRPQFNYGLNLAFMGEYEEARAAIVIALEHEENLQERSRYLLTIATMYGYEGDYGNARQALQAVYQNAEDEGLDFAAFNALDYESMMYIMENDLIGYASLKPRTQKLLAELDESILDENFEVRIKAAELGSKISAAVLAGDFLSARSDLAEFGTNMEQDKSGYSARSFKSLAAFIEMESGNYADAIPFLEESDNPGLDLYRLGVSYEAVGDLNKAKVAYKKHSERYNHSLWYSLTLSKSREALARL